MADYSIRIKDVLIPDISIKDVALEQVFIKDVQVWAAPVPAGAIITLTIDDVGEATGDYSGSYTVPQDSTTGSGTGAQFDITVGYVSNKSRSFLASATINSGNEGSGYVTGEIVTLDMSSVGGSWAGQAIEVLTVTT